MTMVEQPSRQFILKTMAPSKKMKSRNFGKKEVADLNKFIHKLDGRYSKTVSEKAKQITHVRAVEDPNEIDNEGKKLLKELKKKPPISQ